MRQLTPTGRDSLWFVGNYSEAEGTFFADGLHGFGGPVFGGDSPGFMAKVQPTLLGAEISVLSLLDTPQGDEAYSTYQALVGDGQPGIVAFNGDESTGLILRRAALMDWPVVLITGSGGATDELAEQVAEGKIIVPEELAATGVTSESFDPSFFEFVPGDDPGALHGALLEWELVPSAI